MSFTQEMFFEWITILRYTTKSFKLWNTASNQRSKCKLKTFLQVFLYPPQQESS